MLCVCVCVLSLSLRHSNSAQRELHGANPAGRRHEVAAPWSTALRYIPGTYIASTHSQSNARILELFFHDNVTYQWLLTWLQRPAKMYLPNICRIRKIASKTDELCLRLSEEPARHARRHDRSGSFTRKLSHRGRTDSGTVIWYENRSAHARPPASFRRWQNRERVFADLSSVQNQERESQAANQRSPMWSRDSWVQSPRSHAIHRPFLNVRNRKLGEPRTSDENSHSWLLFVLEYMSVLDLRKLGNTFKSTELQSWWRMRVEH